MWVAPGTQEVFEIRPKDASLIEAPTQITLGMAMPDDLFRRLSELGIETQKYRHAPSLRWQKPGIARHVVGSALQDVVFHRQKVGIVAVWRKNRTG